MTGIKDLTLREGSQVPGLDIPTDAGRTVLDRLADLDVGRVEVSFPRARSREGWYRHADDLGLRTAALARAIPADVDAALAVEPDEIEVIVNTSDRQLDGALGRSRGEAKEMLVKNVERARDGGGDPGVTLMDAVRADNGFLESVARSAVDAGADHVTLADTTGSGTPERVAETVDSVVAALDGDTPVAIHTHDDMGVATANAAAGVAAGAESVDATVGGIGERAGNAPLEAVVVFLAERGDDPDVELERVVPACRAVHDALGVDIPPRKPVLGERAYRHESGMHTAAMLSDPGTYEPFDPTPYGGRRDLLFGAASGRGAMRALLEDEGVEPTDERVADLLDRVRTAADRNDDPLTESETRRLVREIYQS